ncbi:hypothetical protein BRADI_2g19415v3 [Brachypodium distachyon]|uniref:Uncharacterized protein n=1 Tax=Brachypodium distachyon TaxID=15368 RepID=A0A0Q3QVF0_BRADI|nr:hypothetical protein BRADI_2g19415v3 [Brachypodium distachyon]
MQYQEEQTRMTIETKSAYEYWRIRRRAEALAGDARLLRPQGGGQGSHEQGSSAGCPGDVSSANDSDEDVIVVQQTNDSPEIKLAPLKKPKTSKKRKESSNASEEKDEKNPFYRSYKSTCGRIGAAADNISSSVQASSAPHPTSHVPSIADVMQMVKDCGVQVGTALMHTATMLIMKPDFREIFSKLQTKEGRLIC